MATTTETEYHLSGCTDCAMLIENADTTGNSRCETEEGEAEYLADVARMTEGLHVATTSWPFEEREATEAEAEAYLAGHIDGAPFRETEDGLEVIDWTEEDRDSGRDRAAYFSGSPCQVCGETLAGDRHPFVGWPVSAP